MSAICDAHKKKEGVEQLYNLGEDRKSDQLEIRRGRENQHRLSSCREDAGMRNMSQRGWAPRPPVEQPRRTGKKHCYGHKSGGSICCSSVHSPTHLSHSKTFSNPFEQSERYIFLKNCVARLYYVIIMILHADVFVSLVMAIQQKIPHGLKIKAQSSYNVFLFLFFKHNMAMRI